MTFISRLLLDGLMAKGIKVTSSIITISGRTDETVIGTMAEEEVPLSLDLLERQVLLVYAVDINPQMPDAVAAANTDVRASLSSTSRTTVGQISDNNVIAAANKSIRAAGFVDGGVAFQDISPESPVADGLDYIGIVSTNDFFVQVQGANNLGLKGCHWRMWCARASVSADIYAALVTGEQLSA